MGQKAISPQWAALSVEGRKAAVIKALRDLSKGGRSVPLHGYDAAKPFWLPSSTTVKRLFGSWTAANVAAKLGTGAARGTQWAKTEDDLAIGDMVDRMDKREILNAAKRPLVVKASDHGQPRRYWDTTRRCYVEAMVYGGGHFEHASPAATGAAS